MEEEGFRIVQKFKNDQSRSRIHMLMHLSMVRRWPSEYSLQDNVPPRQFEEGEKHVDKLEEQCKTRALGGGGGEDSHKKKGRDARRKF